MLEVIAAQGSMAGAAHELALSQPAISKAVSDLETDLGTVLFNRTPRGAELTPSGRILLRRGRAMLDEFSQGLQEIEHLADPTVGEVRIGALESLSLFISSIVERTSRRYPKIEYQIMFSDAASLVRALRDRELDVVIGRSIWADPDMTAEVLFRDRIVVVAAPRHPLVRHRKVTFNDLLKAGWVLGPAESFLSQVMLNAFRQHGLPMPRNVVTTFSIQLRLDLMESGRFLTVYSSAMLEHPARKGRIKALPVDLDDNAGPMAVITLKGRQSSSPTKMVLNETRAIARTIASRE